MQAATRDEIITRPRFGGLLRQRNFRLFWIGETTSEIGNRVAIVALPLLAVTVLRVSTFTVALLTALEFLPWLLIGLPAGAWLDRRASRKVMMVCDAAAALLYLSIPVAAWTGILTLGQVLAVALLTGAVAVFFDTTYQVQLPAIVARHEVTEGNAKLQASSNLAVLGGPSAGGFLVQLAGAATALICNALSFLVSLLCLLRIRTPAGTQDEPGKQAERASSRNRRQTSFGHDIYEGIRFVARDPYLRPLTIWAAIVNFGLTGWDALMMVFLVRVVHVRPALIGLLLGAAGVGSVIGSLLARRVGSCYGTARGLLLGVFCTTPLILLIPLTGPGPRLAFFAAGGLISGAGIAISNVFVASFARHIRRRECAPG
jgi:predicted MFS family arabinose efflux permease